jgi:hypothetical protein
VHAGGPSLIKADVYDLIIVAKQHNHGAEGNDNLSQKITLFKHIRKQNRLRIFVFRCSPGNGRCGYTNRTLKNYRNVIARSVFCDAAIPFLTGYERRDCFAEFIPMYIGARKDG